MEKIILVGVHRSGTRFTRTFLEQMRVPHEVVFADDNERLEEYLYRNPKLVIVKRDPILVLVSTYKLHVTSPTEKPAITRVVNDITISLNRITQLEESYVFVNAVIDAPIDQRAAEMQKVADFVGAPESIATFTWLPVGVTESNPNTLQNWVDLKATLTQPEIDYVLKTLAPYRARWGYDANI